MRPVILEPMLSGWKLFDENGAELDTSSTQTCGLQEALDYIAVHRQNLRVHGSGEDVISSAVPVNVPPLWQSEIIFDPVMLAISPPPGQDGLIFDSSVFLKWTFNGQYVHGGAGAAVRFHPRNPCPGGLPASFGTNNFYFMGINHASGETGYPTGVLFDTTLAEMYGNTFYFEEVKDHWNGLTVLTPGSGKSFNHNIITTPGLHFQKGIGCFVGQSPTDRISGNTWHIRGSMAGQPGSAGFLSYAQDEIITYSNFGTCDVGVKWEASAARNKALIGINHATTKVLDFSISRDNRVL